MARVYVRTVNGKRIWYADCKYIETGRRKRVQRSTGIHDDGTAKSRQTAAENARALEQSLALGTHRVARPKTLTQAIAALIEQLELARRSQSTINIVMEKGAHLTQFFGADRALEAIADDDVRRYAAAARKTRARASVERELRTLAQAFGAVRMRRPELPDLGAKTPPRERFLELVEQQKLIAATSIRRKLHVLAYLQLGCRKSELFKIDAINWDTRELHIAGTKTRKSERWVPIPPELYEAMEARKSAPLMFGPWGRGNADRELRDASNAAGLGDVSFNDLRRTYATHMARAGVPILHLAALMGTSVKMLEDVYARVQRGQHMHDAVAKLPRIRRPLNKVASGVTDV